MGETQVELRDYTRGWEKRGGIVANM